MSITVSVVFVVYLILMVFIGTKFYSKDSSNAEYILGGRSLNAWVGALSAQASDMSGWILLGLPGLAYLSAAGASEAAWTAIGLGLGTYLNWLIVAKRLRVYSKAADDAITIPDYLEKRFRDSTHILRIVAALFIIVFFLIYTASGFAAGAKLIDNVFGVGYTPGLLIAGAVILAYTFLGGFRAVCWTDLFQGLLMVFAIALVPMIAMGMMGDFNPVGYLAQVPLLPGREGSFTLIGIVSALAWGPGYFGQPHILVRFMAIRSPRDIRPARIIAMVWVVIALIFAIMIGMVGKSYFTVPLAEGRNEDVFMEMIKSVFAGSGGAGLGTVLGWCLAGVFLSAILAAVMSTADSQLLVTASAVSEDVYHTFFNKKAPEKTLTTVSRVTVIIVTLIAMGIASDPNSSVFGIVQYAWAGFGGTFGPIILVSLFWRRVNRAGAIAGVVTGGVTVLLWKNLAVIAGLLSGTAAADVQLPTLFTVYELLPAFILSLIVIFAVSLATAPPDKEITSVYDRVQSELAQL